MSNGPTSSDQIDLESFYAFRYRGMSMFAVRAPFAMDGEARQLVGQTARIAGHIYEILAVHRQITGPIARGEPIGVEVRPAPAASDAR